MLGRMKTQVPFVALALCLTFASAAQAGECALVRMYKDNKKIMQHFSTQTLVDGAGNNSACSSACRREAGIIPPVDTNVLTSKKNATTALLRCTFSDNYGGHRTNSKTIAESTVPITQLRAPSPSSLRSSLQGQRPASSDVIRAEIPHPTAPVAPVVRPVTPGDRGTGARTPVAGTPVAGNPVAGNPAGNYRTPVGNYPQPSSPPVSATQPTTAASAPAAGSYNGNGYGASSSGSAGGSSYGGSSYGARNSGGYTSPYDRPYSSPYDHPSLARQLQAYGSGSK